MTTEERDREAAAAGNLPVGSETLDLLLDLELPMSIALGRVQMPLEDLVKLSVGSIVELNRSLDEPVQVLINGCVIATGEVVVVDGNYGVRIQRIASRSERLRTADSALLALGGGEA